MIDPTSTIISSLGVVAAIVSAIYQGRQTRATEAGLKREFKGEIREINEKIEEPDIDTDKAASNANNSKATPEPDVAKSTLNKKLINTRYILRHEYRERFDEDEKRLEKLEKEFAAPAELLAQYRASIEEILQLLQNNVSHKLNEVDGSFNNYVGILKDFIDRSNEVKANRDAVKEDRENIEQIQARIFAETGRYASDIASQGRDIEYLQQQVDNLREGSGDPVVLRKQLRAFAQQLLQLTER